MVTWTVLWLVSELVFFFSLTETEYDRYFKTVSGFDLFLVFIPIRFLIWPVSMTLRLIGFFEVYVGKKQLDVWWFKNDCFKL